MSDYDPYRREPRYPAYPPYQGPYAHPPGVPVAPAATRPHPLTGVLAVVLVLLVAALTVGGIVLAGGDRVVSGQGSVAGQDPAPGGSGSGSAGPGGGGGSSTPAAKPKAGDLRTSGVASAYQQVGVVTILSTLRYQNARSAGTGMVIASDDSGATVLTNNHVIRGATSISVTIESTGRRYTARVVGTAPGSDVAVLELRAATDVAVARLAADANDVRIGDRVIGVGNARGTGVLKAAGGKVTSLNRSITASDESGQAAERLTGLIEVDAPIVSGDSGGPLYDMSGRIVGIDTAASTRQSGPRTAYAIPIDAARDIAKRIGTGVETTSIHIGYPGFLGVTTQNSPDRNGARVVGLLDGGPAEGAGVTEGSTITRVGNTIIRSADTLRDALTLRDPGSKVAVTWTAPGGDQRTATMTLAVGPAD